MAISVTLVDDHPAVLAGMRLWCAQADPPITVLASGPTIDVAWTPPGDRADVVVLDLNLGDRSPTDGGHLRRLVDSGRKVIVYTMREDEDLALACLDLGALAFVTKSEGLDHLVAVIVSAATDRPYLSPALAGAMAADRRPCHPHLSDREKEVLTQWFQCESKHLVAHRMRITVRTVNTYLDRIRLKYANAGRPAPTKAALVARAIQDGLVDLGDL